MPNQNYIDIPLLAFEAEREVLDKFFVFRNILSGEKEEIILGISLIKSGYVLPGLRLLYRSSSVDSLKKVLSNVVLLPGDIANIFFQTLSLSDVKMRRFVGSLGIMPGSMSVKSIKELEVKEIVVNGFPDDVSVTKLRNSRISSSITYHVDDNRRFVVLVNGLRFSMVEEVAQFVEEGNFSIRVAAVFNFGFPSERVFFKITKPISGDDATPYFDPTIRIDSLASRIEANRFVEFFYEFICLIATDFEIINRKNVKEFIISRLKEKNMVWILLEVKNVLSFLYNQNPTTTLRNLNRNVEKFLEDFEIDFPLGSGQIKVLTPVFDKNKYIEDVNYVKNAKSNEIAIISQDNEMRVILKEDGIMLGKINPNTARAISEIGGKIVSSNLVIPDIVFVQSNYLPDVFELWVEIDIA